MILASQERWEHESHTGSKMVEPLLKEEVQNGDMEDHSDCPRTGELPILGRPVQSLPPCPHIEKPPEVPALQLWPEHFQFKALPFSLTAVPHVFTKILVALVAHLYASRGSPFSPTVTIFL